MKHTFTEYELEEIKESFPHIIATKVSLGDCDDYRGLFDVELSDKDITDLIEFSKCRSTMEKDCIYYSLTQGS